MWEWLKQWQPKIKISKRQVAGAIATPVFVWMVCWLWLSLERRPQPHQHREILVSSAGMVAAIAGGIFLVLNLRTANRDVDMPDLSSADLSGIDLNGVDLTGVDLSGANLSGIDLSGIDLSGANLRYVNLSGANLSSANLSNAEFGYADLSNADLRYVNLTGADLRHANLSGANLSSALLRNANLSEANLSGTLLFFINSREVLNLEPLQLKAKPSPFLCNVALPAYSSQPKLDPNRDCSRIPQLLRDRYDIPLEEAQEIVDEARQHRWD
ncbi:pentapeptide repeat-containing protein [cf. Phormidesmis sp. LEGE 11477]|uniref:pentapeptide repeat-containing protein n=1 Tax=cf. Phormidesmis sp. LEGE 11477 TaxID=1828680 RepID=UPI00187F4A58|nr:pentapeptide repeat-containing protein [cf. Phormidesmis sp. LEGE 11477]MBE9060761.1 pentapeptide repeat-containing protein [cf. Phormidesmis sp. LEGE 11477]